MTKVSLRKACLFFCFLAFGLELAIDGDVGRLVETVIGFEAGFRLGSAFENSEIMVEETDPPFEGFDRMIVLQGMCLTLRFFDHFAVCYASSRPVSREMVGIELEKSFMLGRTADDDMFAVTPAFFSGIHRTPKGVDAFLRHKIAHSP
ncbi:MAG: hypothetical protein IKR37_05385 [Paludibacteraceae bacterium]|nr:hypothetical protein [Paludibacteraceae bacterium]